MGLGIRRRRSVVSIAGVANPWPGDLGWFYKINGTSWGGALVIPFITAFAPSFIVKKAIESIFAPQNAPTKSSRRGSYCEKK